MLLMYSVKRTVPRTQPRGTPALVTLPDESCPLWENWNLPFSIQQQDFKILFGNSILCNQNHFDNFQTSTARGEGGLDRRTSTTSLLRFDHTHLFSFHEPVHSEDNRIFEPDVAGRQQHLLRAEPRFQLHGGLPQGEEVRNAAALLHRHLQRLLRGAVHQVHQFVRRGEYLPLKYAVGKKLPGAQVRNADFRQQMVHRSSLCCKDLTLRHFVMSSTCVTSDKSEKCVRSVVLLCSICRNLYRTNRIRERH